MLYNFEIKKHCYAGLPLLAVGAALAIDYKAFDGTYVNCIFR